MSESGQAGGRFLTIPNATLLTGLTQRLDSIYRSWRTAFGARLIYVTFMDIYGYLGGV
jgi:hypothetical protein